MSLFAPGIQPAQNDASYMPDVGRFYSQYGLAPQGRADWIAGNRFQAVLTDDRNVLEAYAKQQSGKTSQINHISPPLHPERLIRWQLAVSVLGGLALVAIYSYVTKRPIIQ